MFLIIFLKGSKLVLGHFFHDSSFIIISLIIFKYVSKLSITVYHPVSHNPAANLSLHTRLCFGPQLIPKPQLELHRF